MAETPNEPLNRLELIALALLHAGGGDADAADAIPQRVWDELHARDLIVTQTLFGGDAQTDTTAAGDAALLQHIEYIAELGIA